MRNAVLGQIRSYQESLGRVPADRRQKTWAWFVQDTWKVRPNVTLDIGLRMYKWGQAFPMGGEASAFSFERRLDAGRLVVALNPGTDVAVVEVALDGADDGRLELVDLDGTEGDATEVETRSIEVRGGLARFDVPPRSGQIRRLTD